MSETFDVISDAIQECYTDLKENQGRNLKIDILTADTARQMILDQIIPEINDEIREACEDHKNYIIHEFKDVSGPTFKLIQFIIDQYEQRGYTVVKKNNTTFMLTW